MTDRGAPAPPVCVQCGTQVAPALLACPSCHRLVHAEELQRLAGDAQRADQAGDSSAALATWRHVLGTCSRLTRRNTKRSQLVWRS